MSSRRKPDPADPAELNNKRVLAERAERIEERRQPIPDLGLNLAEEPPANAAEFLRDEWDKKTFGDAPRTFSKIVYGPDPVFDSCPGLRATIEKVGLHDYAEAAAQAILSKGELAVVDNVLRRGLAGAINNFGVEQVAQAFRDRILRIPCRTVEYEVDRDTDYEIAGSRVLDDAVERYGRPNMAYKFMSVRCMDVLGRRGYEIVKDEKGEPVKVGTLILGEIPRAIADRRREHYRKLAQEQIESEVEKYDDEARRIAHNSGYAQRGVGPLETGTEFTAGATERDESLLGQTRTVGFRTEDTL